MSFIELKINGMQHKLARLDERMAAEQLAWARTKLGDPLKECAQTLKDFPPELHKQLLDEALAQKRRHAVLPDDAPEIQAVLRTVEGMGRLLLAIYQRHNPQLTEDQIWELHRSAVEQHGDKYLEPLMPSRPKG